VHISPFGPEYWLARCDGFRVRASDGSRGEVDEIIEVDDVVVGLLIRFGIDDVHVKSAGVLDIDPVRRVVVVDRGIVN
jgi:hypothetical protein